jgi:hypothetical protein
MDAASFIESPGVNVGSQQGAERSCSQPVKPLPSSCAHSTSSTSYKLAPVLPTACRNPRRHEEVQLGNSSVHGRVDLNADLGDGCLHVIMLACCVGESAQPLMVLHFCCYCVRCSAAAYNLNCQLVQTQCDRLLCRQSCFGHMSSALQTSRMHHHVCAAPGSVLGKPRLDCRLVKVLNLGSLHNSHLDSGVCVRHSEAARDKVALHVFVHLVVHGHNAWP